MGMELRPRRSIESSKMFSSFSSETSLDCESIESARWRAGKG